MKEIGFLKRPRTGDFIYEFPPTKIVRPISEVMRRIISRRRSSTPVVVEEQCYSTLTSDDSSTSCCSSNNLNLTRIIDAEVDSAEKVETSMCYSGGEIIRRRETGLTSEVRAEEEKEEEEEEVDSHSMEKKKKKTTQNMPTESELDEFFSQAEKDVQKQFQNKYNYDIVKDMPMEGRYEWVQLKP